MNGQIETVLERQTPSPEEVCAYLDQIMARFGDPTEVPDAFSDLRAWLFHTRKILLNERSLQAWRDFLDQIRMHPVSDLIQQDPFTARSYDQPRGYAGDAVELDYIYDRDPGPACTALGKILFHEMMQVPECVAVRARREILATAIDDVASRVDSPDIFSVASGHIREAELSDAVNQNRIGRLVALDHDKDTISVLQDRFTAINLMTINKSVYKFVKGPSEIDGKFDLIYATGLYDYLPQGFAQRLTRKLFDLLKSDGRLLIANFLPDNPTAGYMETFMRWDLIYRTENEVRALAGDIPDSVLGEYRVWRDQWSGQVSYLDITRA